VFGSVSGNKAGKRVLLTGLLLWLGLAGFATAAGAECSPMQQQEADEAYRLVYEFVQNNQWEQAVPRLRSVLEICPTHLNALRALGRAYLKLGRLDEAKQTYDKLIESAGDKVEAVDFASLGLVLSQMKNYQEARAAYMKANTLAPDDCGILFNLGMLHMGVQDYRRAVETLEHAREECPEIREKIMAQLPDACKLAAAKEKKIGNQERAQVFEQKYREYAGQAGGSEAYELAAKYMENRQYAEAVKILEEILADSPDHAPSWLSLARSKEQLGNHAGAIDAYEHYLKLKPGDEDATADLVLAYAEQDRCQDALTLARQAGERFTAKGQAAMARINYSWGKALECAGSYAEARDKFKACAASSVDPWDHYAELQVQRMNDLIQREEIRRRQGG
jgi:tetratricopeptide (TPR) repeat protein